MSLVAYDYASGSENEEEDESPSTTAAVIIPEKVKETNEITIESENDSSTTSAMSRLLSDLPKTKSTPTKIVEDTLEDFVPKYQPAVKEKREKVKITIPSLSEFQDDDDDEEPEKKKLKPSVSGSGLLSILPPVRGSPLTNKSFVPATLKNKPPSTDKPKANALVPNAVRRKAELAKKAAIKKITKVSKGAAGSDLESDDDMEMPDTFDEEMWHKVCGRPKHKEVIERPEEVAVEMPMINIAPEPVKPYEGLDNQAFKELVGKSKRPVNIKLVDINEEDILEDKDMWLTKSLTDPDSTPKPAVENPVDPTRKKKHHITYLAEQAKANEQELAGQWAASKYTRNQTRAKYGF